MLLLLFFRTGRRLLGQIGKIRRAVAVALEVDRQPLHLRLPQRIHIPKDDIPHREFGPQPLHLGQLGLVFVVQPNLAQLQPAEPVEIPFLRFKRAVELIVDLAQDDRLGPGHTRQRRRQRYQQKKQKDNSPYDDQPAKAPQESFRRRRTRPPGGQTRIVTFFFISA